MTAGAAILRLIEDSDKKFMESIFKPSNFGERSYPAPGVYKNFSAYPQHIQKDFALQYMNPKMNYLSRNDDQYALKKR